MLQSIGGVLVGLMGVMGVERRSWFRGEGRGRGWGLGWEKGFFGLSVVIFFEWGGGFGGSACWLRWEFWWLGGLRVWGALGVGVSKFFSIDSNESAQSICFITPSSRSDSKDSSSFWDFFLGEFSLRFVSMDGLFLGGFKINSPALRLRIL